jgi:uncharacterized protein YlaI
MSDYYQSDEKRIAELPLFGLLAKSLSVAVQPVQQIKDKAREFHASRQAQEHALTKLRTGQGLTKVDYEQSFGDGRRLAPAIEQLRNAHGFSIDGHGTGKNPYKLCDVSQRPILAMVTPDMKAIYYTLPHWHEVKQQRQDRDSHRCVLCMSWSELRCHHVSYTRLFNEPIEDLMTLCDRCHGRVHEDCRLKFPSGVSTKYAHLLGWKGFETWLLP